MRPVRGKIPSPRTGRFTLEWLAITATIANSRPQNSALDCGVEAVGPGLRQRCRRRRARDLIEPSIAEHHGRLIKTTGDGFIAIFDSPVEAVRCGIVIQQNMIGRNASLPKHQWIEYRIGVNLGDVIIEADDVYGDGVNIASRLEGIAEPGQVFISGGIYEQIKHKAGLRL